MNAITSRRSPLILLLLPGLALALEGPIAPSEPLTSPREAVTAPHPDALSIHAGQINVLSFIPPNLHAAIKAGTSTADLTPYFVAARNAARATMDGTGGVVIVPPGRYRANLTLRYPNDSNITIRGAGRRATLLSPAVNAPVITFDSSAGPVISNRIEDLMMEAPEEFTSPAIRFKGGNIDDEHLLSRLFLRGFTNAIEVLGRCNSVGLRDLEIYEDRGNGIHIDTSSTVGVALQNVAVRHGVGWGLYATSRASNDHMILRLIAADLNSEGNAKGGVHVANADQFSLAPGAYIENNGGHGVEIAGTIARAFDIRGIRSWGNAGDAIRVTATLASGYIGGNMLAANAAPAPWNASTVYDGPAVVTFGEATYFTKHIGNVGHPPSSTPRWWVKTTLDRSARSTVHVATKHAESRVILGNNWEGGTGRHTIRSDERGATHVSYSGIMGGSVATETGPTPSVQGKTVLQVAGGPKMTHLLGGDPGQIIVVHAIGAAATLKHAAGGAGSIYSTSGQDIVAQPNSPVLLWCQESRWMQIGITPANPAFTGSLAVRNAGAGPTMSLDTVGTGRLFSVLKNSAEIVTVENDSTMNIYGPIRPNLPTSPGAPGTLWNDDGTVKVAK